MTRTSGHEKETLRISADAAGKLLVKLRAEQEHLAQRIANLQAVVDAWDSVSGKKAKVDTGLDGVDAANPKKRVAKGQVARHVAQVLSEGGSYDEPDLRKAIADKFSQVYGRATVYTCLRRGFRDHKFLRDGTKWSINPLQVQKAGA